MALCFKLKMSCWHAILSVRVRHVILIDIAAKKLVIGAAAYCHEFIRVPSFNLMQDSAQRVTGMSPTTLLMSDDFAARVNEPTRYALNPDQKLC